MSAAAADKTKRRFRTIMNRLLRTTAMVTALVLIALLLPVGAFAKTLAEWMEGYDTGAIRLQGEQSGTESTWLFIFRTLS